MQKTFKISTKGNTDIINITDEIQKILSLSKSESGIINIFTRHTTAGIGIMEYEPGLIKDTKDMFDKIVPENFPYYHNKLNNDDNGSAHIKASILGQSINVPFENNFLSLGTWQKIVLIDFDCSPREREVIVKILEC